MTNARWVAAGETASTSRRLAATNSDERVGRLNLNLPWKGGRLVLPIPTGAIDDIAGPIG